MPKSAQIISLASFRQERTIAEALEPADASRRRPQAKDDWWRAEREYEVWVALRELYLQVISAAKAGVKIGETLKAKYGFSDDREGQGDSPSYWIILEAQRHAAAALFRVRAPTLAEIK